ncbi:unnamed protein product [Prorocentrum cordatum]|uniref:Uncharacterized protein n=1 Tax=Prorocentrum cordatum TaxID=2364126 RepID=A0ABN9U7X2_9DINO|nr:unnamed protein product [Polarella glacialis]
MVARHRQPRAASALLRAAAAFLPAAALLGASRGAPAWRLSPGVPLAVAALARPLCGLRPRTAPAGTLESAVRARALRRGPKDVDRRAAKIKGLAPTEMARRVALALQERSWFVSGDIAIELFDDEFLFVDRPQGKDQVEADAYVDKRAELSDLQAKMQQFPSVTDSRIASGFREDIERKLQKLLQIVDCQKADLEAPIAQVGAGADRGGLSRTHSPVAEFLRAESGVRFEAVEAQLTLFSENLDSAPWLSWPCAEQHSMPVQ